MWQIEKILKELREAGLPEPLDIIKGFEAEGLTSFLWDDPKQCSLVARGDKFFTVNYFIDNHLRKSDFMPTLQEAIDLLKELLKVS